MLSQEQTAILEILRYFPPSNRLRFGENYWRVMESLVLLGPNKTFSVNQLSQYINNYPVWKNNPISIGDVTDVIKKLEKMGFLSAREDQTYGLSSVAFTALGEFFSLFWRPRGGRTGFMNYLYQSSQRTIQWCCINLRTKITCEKIAEMTGFNIDRCRNYLERLARKGMLNRARLDRYHLIDEEKLFQNLWQGYQWYRVSKPTVKDYILSIMEYYEKISGKEIHKCLKQIGVECDVSTVYKHLRKLEKNGHIKRVGELKKRAVYEIYYALNYENVEGYKEELLQHIRDSITKTGIHVRDDFFTLALKQKPHVLKIFSEQINSILVQDYFKDQPLSLWIEFVRSLPFGLLKEIRDEISSIGKDKDIENSITELTRKYKISPAVLLLVFGLQGS